MNNLYLCSKYLATGSSFYSLAFAFRMEKSTASSIVAIPYPKACGPKLASGSRMHWPSGLPKWLAVR
jgi:hypothetical protein